MNSPRGSAVLTSYTTVNEDNGTCHDTFIEDTICPEEAEEYQLVNTTRQLAYAGADVILKTVEATAQQNGVNSKRTIDQNDSIPTKTTGKKINFSGIDTISETRKNLDKKKPNVLMRRISSIRYIDLQQKQKYKCWIKFFITLICILLIVISVLAIYIYKFHKESKVLSTQTLIYQEERKCINQQITLFEKAEELQLRIRTECPTKVVGQVRNCRTMPVVHCDK